MSVPAEQRMARNIVAQLIREYLAESDAEVAAGQMTFMQRAVRAELRWIERRLGSELQL